MARFRLSSDADLDLNEIYLFSFEAFGESQADAYMEDLRAAFVRLADMPELGAVFEPLAPQVRRLRCREHEVFYTLEADGVLIVRVLHGRMDHVRHLTQTDE